MFENCLFFKLTLGNSFKRRIYHSDTLLYPQSTFPSSIPTVRSTESQQMAAAIIAPLVRYANQLTLWSWALLERPPVVKPLDSFPAFYGTRRFITAFTRAVHLSLSWARPIQSTPPHSISPRSILPIFCRLGRLINEFVQVRGSFQHFVRSSFLQLRVVSHTLPPQLEDHPLSFVRGCLFNAFAATLHS
jgi:hypothetical protein